MRHRYSGSGVLLVVVMLGVCASKAVAQTSNDVAVCEYFGSLQSPPRTSPYWTAEFQPASGKLQCSLGYQGTTPIAPFEVQFAAVRLLLELHRRNSELEKRLADLESVLLDATSSVAGAIETINTISKRNREWRDDALEKNLSAIAGVPAKLGTDENLRKALAAALASDKAFIELLKQALK